MKLRTSVNWSTQSNTFQFVGGSFHFLRHGTKSTIKLLSQNFLSWWLEFPALRSIRACEVPVESLGDTLTICLQGVDAEKGTVWRHQRALCKARWRQECCHCDTKLAATAPSQLVVSW